MALWYEKNLGKIYLPPELEHLREKEWLDGKEVQTLYGFKRRNDAPKMMNEWGIESKLERREFPSKKNKDGKQYMNHREVKLYRFTSIEKHVLGWLPSDFPWLDKENGVKYSNALFVTAKGFTNPQKANSPVMFEACNYSTVHRPLGLADEKNIFKRYGYKMPDGSPMTILTHEIRHWLNTIAERGGLSDWERDFWSGRAPTSSPDITSLASEAYLHNSLEDLTEAAGMTVEVLDQSPAKDNPFARALANRAVSLDEFEIDSRRPTVHTGEFGFCIHPMSQSPCQMQRDCLNCMEHCVLKGDSERTERIRKVQKMNLWQLQESQKFVAEEFRNADKWYITHVLSTMRTGALLEHLDDPELPAGTIIMLKNPFQYSPFRNAIEHRATTLGDAASLALAEKIKRPDLPEVAKLLIDTGRVDDVLTNPNLRKYLQA